MLNFHSKYIYIYICSLKFRSDFAISARTSRTFYHDYLKAIDFRQCEKNSEIDHELASERASEGVGEDETSSLPLPSFPTLQQNHKSAGIASCCIREATRRHTPSSSGLLPFPRPVPSPDDDPFPTPPSPLPVCTRVLRSTSVTAFRSASLEGLADQPTPSHQPPFPFHP